jgi:hypothetical protein
VLLIALCCCAFAVATRVSAQSGSAGASPEPSASVSPQPQASAAATPTAMPTPIYRYIFIPSPAPSAAQADAPNIREIDITNSVLYAPGELHVRVLTSSAVVSVTAGTLGHDIPIPSRSAGVFAFDGYIPNVPDYARNRSFDVEFTASTADGRAATVTLSLTLK